MFAQIPHSYLFAGRVTTDHGFTKQQFIALILLQIEEEQNYVAVSGWNPEKSCSKIHEKYGQTKSKGVDYKALCARGITM